MVTARKRLYMKKWRQRNKERVKLNWKIWRAKNTERLAEKDKRRTPAAKKTAYTKWYRRVREQYLAIRRKRRQENLQVERARGRAWDKANKPKRLAKDHRRRAQKLGTMVGPVDFSKVLTRARGKCGICKKAFNAESTIHFDHIVPLSKGGAHIETNLQAAHAVCNLRKGNRI